MTLLKKIISGGQTGADTGALLAAHESRVLTGGTMPKGFTNENGKNPLYARLFDMEELTNVDWKVLAFQYVMRTKKNVADSDGTLIFTKTPISKGSKLTMETCMEMNKPFLVLDPDTEGDLLPTLTEFITSNKVEILNVAGNRESVNPGIENKVEAIITRLIMKIHGELVN